jgi:hypothetical protein
MVGAVTDFAETRTDLTISASRRHMTVSTLREGDPSAAAASPVTIAVCTAGARAGNASPCATCTANRAHTHDPHTRHGDGRQARLRHEQTRSHGHHFKSSGGHVTHGVSLAPYYTYGARKMHHEHRPTQSDTHQLAQGR